MKRWLLLFCTLLLAVPVMAQQTTTAEDEIAALLDSMTDAVLARDQETYLSYVDLSDPLFALEHTRWSDEWANDDILLDFSMEAENFAVEDGETTADLTMQWRIQENPAQHWIASYPVHFTPDEQDGSWHYAGEYWPLVLESEHFVVRAVPETEDAADTLLPLLPEIYEHVTTSLDHEPSARNEIKLYATSEALVASTLLSLPRIHGWNEPGEALKLFAEGGFVDESIVAHEFTHFLEFDMAGTQHSRFPWWLSEGLAQYVSSEFWGDAYAANYLAISQAWLAAGELADWDSMRVFEETPLELWQHVYPQGYAFARFVTETYGQEPRNEWLRAMSTEMEIEDATKSVFGVSFAELDADFRAWLGEQ
jgi:hypothetical protein